jgi:hypothetical protein
MRQSIAILLLAWLLAGAAAAQEMRMHRKQAGEPDATGWMSAQSTEGRFSVRMPIRFNDFTVVETNVNAPAERTHTVGARSSEGIALVATRIVYRRGAAGAKEYFARLENGEGLAGKPQRLRKRQAAGRPVVDFELGSADSVSYMRAVLLESEVMLLTVEAPRARDEDARLLVSPFFESLQADLK